MRISTAHSQQISVNAILNQQATLAKTQLQISSGLKNLSPADDPLAAKKVLDLQAEIDKTDQYQRNVDVATSRNSLESSVLANSREALETASELALQALNEGTINDDAKIAIAEQIKQIQAQMLGLANTQDESDEYIFSSALSNTPTFSKDPYVFQGGGPQREIQIGPDRKIADGDSGFSIFEDIPSASPAATRNIFDTLDSFIDALTGAATPYTQTVSQALDDIKSTIDGIGTAEAKAGARINALEAQQNQNEGFLVATKTTLSETKDLDLAEAITRLESEELALTAALQTFSRVQNLSLFNFL